MLAEMVILSLAFEYISKFAHISPFPPSKDKLYPVMRFSVFSFFCYDIYIDFDQLPPDKRKRKIIRRIALP